MGPESEQILPPLRLEVLDVMRLVKYHIHPWHTAENVLIRENELVRGDAYVESVWSFPSMPPLFSFTDIPIIGHDFETR